MTTDTTSAPAPRGSEGQTFLLGETIYLRGLELGDAKHVLAWHDSPFPISAERAEELLKEEIPKKGEKREYLLIASRVTDDVPVGSVAFKVWDWRTGDVTLRANPAFGEAGAAVKAEILRLIVPWLQLERDLMAVWVDMASDETVLQTAADAIGMRLTSRIREFFWRDGARRDLLTYEALHPVWLERLGDPRDAPIERSGTGEARPTPPPVRLDGDPPPNAVMVGKRIYLRPIQAEDAEPVARWSRQETETFFDQGRHVRSPISWAYWSRKLMEEDPPSWIRFAIVLRENDELIGANGISDIDWVHHTAETETEIYRSEYRGGGYGSEAKHLLLEYAFERLGLHMVRSYVWMPNTRSAAALRKQGYRDAGRFHWTGLKHGHFTGELSFDLLADEWRALKPSAISS